MFLLGNFSVCGICHFLKNEEGVWERVPDRVSYCRRLTVFVFCNFCQFWGWSQAYIT